MPESPPTGSFPPQPEAPTLAYVASDLSRSPPPAGRYLGNYELLEEIGRGGMGVVFKARHRALGRIVALKMILAGQLASADDVRRFRTEAESAALLDHPNIVPIHEVDEVEGQHFFAIKFIEGGALGEQIPRLVKETRTAVHLLVKVARAVDHAHKRGVLHRDLKPANILLDGRGEPHVTDFGLAKRTGDAVQTQSGAIVGTPAYMAPEQARAEKGQTTAADVYSLGAVLYECLTGRPPFQADSAFEVILQVIEKEPTPPSALSPKFDPELEAVCLKCLAKDPAQRYKSAAALADDLEAWLAGEPVTARPPSTLGRLRQWLRKDFRAASLTILLGCVLGACYSASHWSLILGQAGSTRATYATSFPSETPPAAALWLSGDVAPQPSVITWAQAVPPTTYLGVLGICMALLALILGGLLNVRVLRPKSLASALSAGLATGIVATVASLLLGSGYTPLNSLVLWPSAPDLRLIADGYRAEALRAQAGQGAALEEWEREVSQRHPDLVRGDFPREERARALAHKITNDISMRLLTGMWFCFAGVGAFIVLPLVSSTLIAKMLDARGRRGWWLFLHYLELGVPCAILLPTIGGSMLLTVALPSEPPVFQLLALSVWAVAGGLMFDRVLAWRAWRRALIAGWIVLGLGLLAAYLCRAVPDLMAFYGPGRTSFQLLVIVTVAALALTAAYGIFVRHWRWYVRFGAYLGIVLVAAPILFFVMR